jgi:hypothetical protein
MFASGFALQKKVVRSCRARGTLCANEDLPLREFPKQVERTPPDSVYGAPPPVRPPTWSG